MPAPIVPRIFKAGTHTRSCEDTLITYVISTSDSPGIFHGTFLAPDYICTVVNGLAPRAGLPACKRVKTGLADAIALCKAWGIAPILFRGPWAPLDRVAWASALARTSRRGPRRLSPPWI